MALLMFARRREVLEVGRSLCGWASLGDALQHLWLQHPETTSLAALARMAVKWYPEEHNWSTSGVLVLDLEAELKGRKVLAVRLLPQQSDCSYKNCGCVPQLSGNGARDGTASG